MSEEIERLTKELRDTDAGWVNRRDAAENLGKMAVDAVEALRAQTDDPDVDIKDAVRRAAGWASSALQGIKPFAERSEYPLDDLVKGLAKEGSRSVSARGKGYEVKVELDDGRSQIVNIVPIKPENRPEAIRVSTRCGAPTKDAYYTWALKMNMSTVQCAIALTEEDGKEMFVMANTFLGSHVTPDEIKASVKEIAFYGDWIEKRMTGGDVF